MITVIIPALNEAKTIHQVVQFCKQQPKVSEVIVIDDTSEDDTAKLAQEAGAVVVQSAARGKGISMKEGIAAAKNDIIVFLDGDIDPYPAGTIDQLTKSLLHDEADFVKGSFSRNAGRVTELVAKPLLAIFFPALSSFAQPLSGMIAGKKQFFRKLEFFNDYGVDIGILLDMYLMKARIQEINIGYIENKSKPWEGLGKMSKEVARAIISKARQEDATTAVLNQDMASIEEINQAMHEALQENLSEQKRMAVFDVDGTVLTDRFIDVCAREYGFTAKLEDLREQERDPLILTKRIALLLKGISMDALLNTIHGIKMVADFKETVSRLKEKGYLVGLISHGYTLVTNYIVKNVEADFAIANQLEFFNGKATGEVNMPSSYFASPDSVCGHAFCKTNALQYLCEKFNVQFRNCIAVGDGRDDLCMIGHAGKGVAFCTKETLLEKVAFKNIREKSFRTLFEII
jgi:phosphoserine phosphatase SerB